MSLARSAQPRVLAPPPAHGLQLVVGLAGLPDVRAALGRLAAIADPDRVLVALGSPVVAALGATVPGLAPFEAVAGPGVSVPSTQGAIWLAVHAGDPGEQLLEAHGLLEALGPGFVVDDQIAAFRYREGRDLTGYLDGTANPVGDDAVLAALLDGPPGLAGSTFGLIQRWEHDRPALEAMSQPRRDHTIGRRLSDDEELDDAPESAHVKRTAQEDLGFLVRRSMPWGDASRHGLVFVAFAADPHAFDRHLRRMTGLTDGIVDALFTLSRPRSGGRYWCPPVKGGRLDLSALG